MSSFPQSSALTGVLAPTAEACGLPNEVYTSDAYFERERDVLFAGIWACIGRGSDAPSPGDVCPVDMMGLPLVLVRNGDGTLRVFHNVCSHRGNRLVAKACRVTGAIRCPYHSWTYALDGALKGTPHIGGVGRHELEGFDRERHGLRPVRSAEWLDLVFVNLSGNAPEFDAHIEPLIERWEPLVGADDLARLQIGASHARLRMELAANWKLAVENFCESYHLPWVHPALNKRSRIEDHYHILGGDLFAGQGTVVYDPDYLEGERFPCFEGWPEDKHTCAEYIALFPNVWIGLHVDHVFTVILSPSCKDRTVETFQFYYLGDAAGERFANKRATSLEAWHQVFGEDIGVVEGMQVGRSSPAFRGGVFSPVMDEPTHQFHQWVARRLLESKEE
jgi:choline monooxygenase